MWGSLRRFVTFEGLFAKILLWFWAAMALVAATLILSSWVTQPARDDSFQLLRGRARSGFLLAVLDIYEAGGAEAAERFLSHGPPGQPARDVRLFDASGASLLSGESPPALVSVVKRVLATGVTEEADLDGRPVVVRLLASHGGGHVVGVIEARQRRPEQGLLHHPLLWPLRGLSAPDESVAAVVLRLLLVLAATFVLCWWLARYLTLPIVSLRAATHAMAAGCLGRRVAEGFGGRRDEIFELASDFDAMAERVEGLLAGQRRLVSDISHELRTPLTRLSVALELVRGEAGDGAQAGLERMAGEVRRLDELIGEILTLARLDDGRHPVTSEMVDLGALAADVASDTALEAEARGCQVTAAAETGLSVMGSRELLRRAIENVTRNAVRYTASGTTVTIGARRRDVGDRSVAVVEVADRGPGVSEDMLGEMFQPFVRCDRNRDRRTGGVGLGLAIAKRAVEYHGGAVRAENLPEGGLKVVMVVPLVEV